MSARFPFHCSIHRTRTLRGRYELRCHRISFSDELPAAVALTQPRGKAELVHSLLRKDNHRTKALIEKKTDIYHATDIVFELSEITLVINYFLPVHLIGI